jgi:hypothetical protein
MIIALLSYILDSSTLGFQVCCFLNRVFKPDGSVSVGWRVKCVDPKYVDP